MPDYYIAFWNLENLFDVSTASRRSDKLKRVLNKELKGWTAGVLNRKIKQLAAVITQMNQGAGPDILGICEIENDHVMQKLVDALGPLARNYAIAHHDMSDNRGIDVGFIYDADLFTPENQWSHFIVKRYATRDLFQVNFRTNAGRLLILIGNHWPSRSGGQYGSEPYRIIAGETLAYWHQRIVELQGKDAAIVAMGDFNDEPFNRSLMEYAQAMQARPQVTRARIPKFLNLMWDQIGEGRYTYYYSGKRNFLDQFLVSKGLVTGNAGMRVLPGSVEVVAFPGMTDSKGAPIRFGKGASANPAGYSDHLPIGMVVRES
jgi:hypothetical protein